MTKTIATYVTPKDTQINDNWRNISLYIVVVYVNICLISIFNEQMNHSALGHWMSRLRISESPDRGRVASNIFSENGLLYEIFASQFFYREASRKGSNNTETGNGKR